MPEESIFDLSRERLELIDHDIYKWQCCAEGCTRGTYVWDYGEDPMYYIARKVKGSQWAHKARWRWYCGIHWKMDKRGIDFPCKEIETMDGNMTFVKSITVTDIKFKL